MIGRVDECFESSSATIMTLADLQHLSLVCA